MLLDALAEHNMQYTDAVEAALHTNKYNLALTFIRKQRKHEELRRTNKLGQNLWHVLVLTADRQHDKQQRVSLTDSLYPRFINVTSLVGCVLAGCIHVARVWCRPVRSRQVRCDGANVRVLPSLHLPRSTPPR